jgi:hypothetical protein
LEPEQKSLDKQQGSVTQLPLVAAQLAATAGVGALIDMITGRASAAGAYFSTNARRDTDGDFWLPSTR